MEDNASPILTPRQFHHALVLGLRRTALTAAVGAGALWLGGPAVALGAVGLIAVRYAVPAGFGVVSRRLHRVYKRRKERSRAVARGEAVHVHRETSGPTHEATRPGRTDQPREARTQRAPIRPAPEPAKGPDVTAQMVAEAVHEGRWSQLEEWNAIGAACLDPDPTQPFHHHDPGNVPLLAARTEEHVAWLVANGANVDAPLADIDLVSDGDGGYRSKVVPGMTTVREKARELDEGRKTGNEYVRRLRAGVAKAALGHTVTANGDPVAPEEIRRLAVLAVRHNLPELMAGLAPRVADLRDGVHPLAQTLMESYAKGASADAWTPRGHEEAAKMLDALEAAGANPGRRGPDGRTPVDIAHAAGFTALSDAITNAVDASGLRRTEVVGDQRRTRITGQGDDAPAGGVHPTQGSAFFPPSRLPGVRPSPPRGRTTRRRSSDVDHGR